MKDDIENVSKGDRILKLNKIIIEKFIIKYW